MAAAIRLGDGLRIELGSGETIVADARTPTGDVAVVTHAHGDHLYRRPPDAAVWSALTRDLAATRRSDAAVPERITHPNIDLLDAGHVPGSRAALIHGRRRMLYTGDVCTRDRFYLEGFDPPAADVLIVESTYGTPEYAFPPIDEVRTAVHDWLSANAGRPAILFGYTLGRAQEIEYLLAGTARERVFVSPSIAAVDGVIADHLDVDFPGVGFDDGIDLRAGDALVLPGRRTGQVETLIEESDAVTAALSGWAVEEGYRYARGVDAAFPLSDHCDFRELCDLVRAVDPDTVYTLHGSAERFAASLTTAYGYDATALKPGQHRLDEFG